MVDDGGGGGGWGAEVAGGPDISDTRCYERGGIEKIVEEEVTAAAVLQYRGYCSRGGGCEGERAAARVGGAGNAGRRASPTAGKREGISF